MVRRKTGPLKGALLDDDWVFSKIDWTMRWGTTVQCFDEACENGDEVERLSNNRGDPKGKDKYQLLTKILSDDKISVEILGYKFLRCCSNVGVGRNPPPGTTNGSQIEVRKLIDPNSRSRYWIAKMLALDFKYGSCDQPSGTIPTF